MATSRFFDASGKMLSLGPQIGIGGEGTVYELLTDPQTAAKIYLKPTDKVKAEKLTAMVSVVNQRLRDLTAWPTSTVVSDTGKVVGFLMPKISGFKPIFEVYVPKLRFDSFPKADWHFLIHAASNLARAFSVVHSFGYIIGDVKHDNMLVSNDATMKFIDTDSFQIKHNSQRWLCGVGVSTYQPPEMQGADYTSIVRTSNHDAFGLAVLIFQLLCMGRHPFMGVYSGSGEPPDTEQAIARHRYAYSREQTRTQMSPPPGTLSISHLGDTLGAMFEAAFAQRAGQYGRPSAEQWATTLQRFANELKRCGANSSHSIPPNSKACPWCEFEKQGIAYYPITFVGGQKRGAGIVLLWQEIEKLVTPIPPPPLKRPDGSDTTPHSSMFIARRNVARKKTLTTAIFIIGVIMTLCFVSPDSLFPPLLAVACVSIGFWFLQTSTASADSASHLLEITGEWRKLEDEWLMFPIISSFKETRAKLTSIKKSHEQLREERQLRCAKLVDEREKDQREQFLKKCRLTAVAIPGIGKNKVATLLSFGIVSAADIQPVRIARIPGFGPKTIESMVAFKNKCVASFKFDPKCAVDPASISAIDRDLGLRQAQMQASLQTGLAKLNALIGDASNRRVELIAREAELKPVFSQALANARVFYN